MRPIEKLVTLLEEVSGNVVPDREHLRLERLAENRAIASGHRNLEQYIGWLRRERDSGEWRALLSEVTINESYLFRTPQHFEALADRILPELMARRSGAGLRVWSAGTARGEEAVSLAIVLSEHPALVGHPWSILATDIDDRALAEAGVGVYGPRAMSRVESARLGRWFERVGAGWGMIPTLRRRIEYRHLNLVREPLDPPGAPFDIVFIRNVLIYFRPESQRRVVDSLATALAPDGVVFLGPSESLWQVSDALRPRDLESCFCYQLPAPSPSTPRSGGHSLPHQPDPVMPDSGSAPECREHFQSSDEPPRPDIDLASLRSEVLNLLEAGAADEATRRLVVALERRFDDPELRALAALARDREGDLAAARRGYRAVLYLEPRLFQVRLLLANCLERSGRPGRADTERRAALVALLEGKVTTLPGSERLGLPSEAEALAELKGEGR